MSPLRDAAAYDSLATAAPAVRGLKPSESLPWALSPSGSSWRWPYLQVRACALAGIMLLCSCSGFRQVEVLDARLLREARLALRSPRTAASAEIEDGGEKEAPGVGKAILGELLAIFPGILVPGLGHYYAGDHATAKLLTRVGVTGEALLVAGAGVGTAGYFVMTGANDVGPAAGGFSLMLLGAAAGVLGVPFFATAWFYDMIDTPRAVLSGGQPAPVPKFMHRMDEWGPPRWEWEEP